MASALVQLTPEQQALLMQERAKRGQLKGPSDVPNVVYYGRNQDGSIRYYDANRREITERFPAAGDLDDLVRKQAEQQAAMDKQRFLANSASKAKEYHDIAQTAKDPRMKRLLEGLGQAFATSDRIVGSSSLDPNFWKTGQSSGGQEAWQNAATAYGNDPRQDLWRRQDELLAAQRLAVQDKAAREAAAYSQYMQSLDPMRQRAAGQNMISDLAGEAQRQKLLGDIATQAAMAQRGSYNPAIARAALMQQSGAGQQMAAQIAAQRAQEQAQAQQAYTQGLGQAAGLSQNAQQLAQGQFGQEANLGIQAQQLSRMDRQNIGTHDINRRKLELDQQAMEPNALDYVGAIAGIGGGAAQAVGMLGGFGGYKRT